MKRGGRQTDRQTDRLTDLRGEGDRHTDRLKRGDRQTDRQTDREVLTTTSMSALD